MTSSVVRGENQHEQDEDDDGLKKTKKVKFQE